MQDIRGRDCYNDPGYPAPPRDALDFTPLIDVIDKAGIYVDHSPLTPKSMGHPVDNGAKPVPAPLIS